MQHLRRISGVALALCAAFTLSLTAFAAESYPSSTEAAADLTGRTTESILTEQQDSGKSLGAIVAEAGKLPEFHTAVLEIQKTNLNALVEAGRITRTQADDTFSALRDRQLLCDGSGCTGTNCGSYYAPAYSGTRPAYGTGQGHHGGGGHGCYR